MMVSCLVWLGVCVSEEEKMQGGNEGRGWLDAGVRRETETASTTCPPNTHQIHRIRALPSASIYASHLHVVLFWLEMVFLVQLRVMSCLVQLRRAPCFPLAPSSLRTTRSRIEAQREGPLHPNLVFWRANATPKRACLCMCECRGDGQFET